MPLRPLADIRIIAVEQYGAGPFGSVHLADLGAEVIKIEDPRFNGDVGRYVPPFQDGEDSLFYETFNRNKKSLSLDLSTDAGRSVFEDLVKTADAVFSNLRGDVPAKLGILYDDLKHLNPAIVCVSISGFGMTGPRAKQPGYDYILQGLTGWMSVTGEPDGPPTKTGLSLVDYSGGLVGALSLLSGVHAARRDGVGMDCDVSLYDTALGMLTYPATWWLNEGYEAARTSHSAHPSLVPFQLFQAADDEWFLVGCAKEKFWTRLATVIGRPDFLEDPRFADFAGRFEHREELLATLTKIFQQEPADHWITLLTNADIPTGPVFDVAQALGDDHAVARQMIAETEHPRWGTIKQLVSPVRVGDPNDYEYRRAPHRNEHADEILDGLLGYDAERVAGLTQDGAFG